MTITKQDLMNGAKRWQNGLFELQEIAENGDKDNALLVVMANRPNATEDVLDAHLIVQQRCGFIEGLKVEGGKVVWPVNIRVTEKGVEYYERMAKEALAAANAL